MAGAPVGNKNGTKNRPWADAIRRALARTKDGEGRDALDRIADRLVQKAETDLDQFAINELANRSDGKPMQATELTGADGKDLFRQASDDELDQRIAELASKLPAR